MAYSSLPPSLLLFLFLIASAANAATPAANSHESEDMLQSLRNYGYTLFTNGISTSDLKYQLLSDSSATAAAASPTSNFTLFAPRDELLYALDMAADAAVYVSTLRYHVVPNCRHTFADLKNLTVPFLDTLLPHYAVLIGKVRDIDVTSDRPSIAVVVDGVRVTFPDLYVGSRIVVHGIDGILLTGLNMSRDLIDENDHLPPAASPAATSIPPGNNASHAIQFDQNNSIPAPAPALRTPSVSVAPASSEGSIPAEGIINPISPSPASSEGNIPAKGKGILNPIAPNLASSEGNIPAKGTLNPIAPTPASSEGNIPAEGTLNPIAPTPALSHVGGEIPAAGTPTEGNDNAAPLEKGISTAPASQIDRSNVKDAPAGGPTTPTSQLDRSDNIPAAAAPTIAQDQTEKVKKLGGKRKQIGKTQPKERRRRRRHHGRRRPLGDL